MMNVTKERGDQLSPETAIVSRLNWSETIIVVEDVVAHHHQPSFHYHLRHFWSRWMTNLTKEREEEATVLTAERQEKSEQTKGDSAENV